MDDARPAIDPDDVTDHAASHSSSRSRTGPQEPTGRLVSIRIGEYGPSATSDKEEPSATTRPGLRLLER